MTSITEQRNDQMANSPEQTDQLMDYLLATHKLEDLQASLLNSLSTCGWTERVRNLAFELFRTEDHSRFEDVVDTIVNMATSGSGAGSCSPSLGKRKRDGEEDSKLANGAVKNGKRVKPNPTTSTANGAGEVTVKKEAAEGSNSIADSGPLASYGSSASDIAAHYNVQIPERAVNSGVKFLQDSMHELFSSDTEDQPNGTRGHDPESDDDIPIARKEMKKKASDQPKTNGHPLPKSNT
ncbi:TPA_exp: Uncharacterized protein A8136_5140 [Trichophyton benhamiae CBS 112371]|uniref:Uncharacterized protein n=1 Tax=Arthroderma benhamiae (strain ATCC MYA-4681 / CBS 112371) TaxID=663331 RepID=D4B4C3_ARTBC|nr:uncharacterized protein ARB_03312 [Trichophyton benhamiae CBS 112371]EFE29971.1 hypothetical protein ARB_03312 [Trichophyton benhamiae CBS 112371]DAA73215.1 TPA_exp: Uncharacterized protein A8136_5140 [Trichophyton benhamiae CBS 112371]